jgi:hypothetical protein
MCEVNFPPYKPLLKVDILSVNPLPGVVYLMKRSELGLFAWCLGSWWCVL